MYIIQRGASTMFYKNGILSRQPPTKVSEGIEIIRETLRN